MSRIHPDDETVPTFELRDPEDTEIELPRSLQRILLKHPVACQAAFNALLAEGRRFNQTTEGREWSERLAHSSLLQKARLVFDLSTLGLLEEGEAAHVPSAYLDAIFLAASGTDTDELLNHLFWNGAGTDGQKNLSE